MVFTPTEQGEVRRRGRCAGRSARAPRCSSSSGSPPTASARWSAGCAACQRAGSTSHPGENTAEPADVERIVNKVVAAGRRPVLLGANSADVAPYGKPQQVFHVVTRRDSSSLVAAPKGTWSLTINVWMAAPMYTR